MDATVNAEEANANKLKMIQIDGENLKIDDNYIIEILKIIPVGF